MLRKSIIFLFTFVFIVVSNIPGIQAVSSEASAELSVELSAEASSEASAKLSGKVIILDAGHGTSTTNKYVGYDEQVTMFKLAQKIKPLLESQGATVYMTRTTDETVLLAARAAKINIWALEAIKDARQQNIAKYREASGNIANGATANGDTTKDDIAEIDRLLGIMHSIVDNPEEIGAVYMNSPFKPERTIHPDLTRVFELQDNPEIGKRFLVISLHSNATGKPINESANGASAFHISTTHKNTSKYYTGYSYIEQSRDFANVILDHIAKVGIQKRGASIENYFMIREHNVPGVLVENGFHTNASDRAKLSDDSFLDRLAYAYLDAITAYFDGLSLPERPPVLPNPAIKYGIWCFIFLTSELGYWQYRSGRVS